MKVSRDDKKKLKYMQNQIIDAFGVNGYGWLLALIINGLKYYGAGDKDEWVDIETVTLKFNGGYPTTWYCDKGKLDHYERSE